MKNYSRRIALVGLVLGLWSGLDAGAHFATSQVVQNVNVTLSILPAQAHDEESGVGGEIQAAENWFEVYLLDISRQYEPIDSAQVQLRFRMLDHDMGEQLVVAEPQGYGSYRASGRYLSMAGRWQIVTELRISEREESLRAQFEVTVQEPLPVRAPSGPLGLSRSNAMILTSGSSVLAIGALALSLLFWRRPGHRSVAIIALLIGSGAVIFGIYLTLQLVAGGSGSVRITAQASEIEASRSLFLQHCASCHGESGRGDGPQARHLPVRPADLSQHLSHHSESELLQIILQGRPPFMPPASVSEEQARQIIAFLRSLAAENDD
jgi:mono/diheme cytochrome c family protein